MRNAIQRYFSRHANKRADARAIRRLAEMPDRLRADVGLGPKNDGPHDWMPEAVRPKPYRG